MENHANLVKTTTPALVEEKQDSNAKNTETGNKKEAPLPLLKGKKKSDLSNYDVIMRNLKI